MIPGGLLVNKLLRVSVGSTGGRGGRAPIIGRRAGGSGERARENGQRDTLGDWIPMAGEVAFIP